MSDPNGVAPEAVRDALLRTDFSSFLAKSFSTVDPAATYLHNWHIEVMADYLQRVTQGQLKRLIINIPPRNLKSLTVSVAWPAWLLGRKPSLRVMAASYSAELAIKHSLDCRQVMTSPWYREVFADTYIAKDQNEKHRFTTTKRGFRFATSVGGVATGEGGDVLIVDDPHTPLQAASNRMRIRALDWFDQTFMSRLNHKKKGAVVVIMQRLHADDLTGHLLNKKGSPWELLELPSIATEKQVFSLLNEKVVARDEGQLLHPRREGFKELELLKESMGSQAFSAQYQQCPLPQEGAMLKSEWFQRFDCLPEAGEIVQSWDTAIKAGNQNDFSVCATWMIVRHESAKDGFYLVDMVVKRLEFPELCKSVVRQAAEWQPMAILIEDKASGQSLLQELRRGSSLPLIAIQPKHSKTERFASVTPLFEAGRVYLPRYASWLGDLESELLAFPHVSHDDQVDAISQFLTWVRSSEHFYPRVRRV